MTFGEQLRILKIQKIAREQEEERQRIAQQERLYLEKIQAVRNKQHVEAVINMEQMASESIKERFGIQDAGGKGVSTILGAVISKFGSQLDKKVQISNIMNKNQKKLEVGGFNRLGLASKGIDEDLKAE